MADALTNFTDFVIKPSAPFAAGVILFGVVWGFFKGVESVLTDDTKLEIAVWLLGVKTAGKVRGWPDTFAKVFDRVFGKKHLSWQCFGRSCIASYTLACVGLWVSSLRISFSVYPTSLPIAAAVLAVWVFFVNIWPDFGSLLKARLILRHMVTTYSMTLWGVGLVTDFALSMLIAWAGTIPLEIMLKVLFPATGVGGGEPLYAFDIHLFLRTAQNFPFLVLPTLFFSIWLWLYAGSGFVLKSARRFDIGFQWFNRRFDVEKKPLQSIGLVAGALVALIYWAAVIVNRIANR